MIDVDEDIEYLQRAGRFSSREEFIEQAFHALLKNNPELRVELAVEKFTSGAVSLNRAAEIASMSSERFKEELSDRGIDRDVGFLSEDERDERLSGL